ncbi:alpha/beta hydrolase [Nocardiopsis sp. CNT-189]|uniref:alpha/beta hydrolase n=1 Tax=Nocardiopsis oceanisediminis TaxID=2816862 RepID=UPI003B3AC7A7
MNRTGLAACAAALAVAAAGCTGEGADPGGRGGADRAPEPGLEGFYSQEIDWGACEDGDEDFECGAYEVPLDYGDPGGERLEIAVKRRPAAAEAKGSLLVNPGGPGGSGYDYAGAASSVVGLDVRKHFDVVGFDPRGVARSEPIACLDLEGMDDYLGTDVLSEDGDADPAEVTDAGVERLEEGGRAFVEGCRERAGDLMMHMGTDSVARDMDVLRAVLGDEELTYLGKSYGTMIGAVYADLFPERVGAVVLDGALDPELDQLEAGIEQASGFETALRAFVEDCQGLPDCPVRGSGADAGTAWIEDLLEKAGREPLEGPPGDDREVGRARAELGIAGALYSEQTWPELRAALAEADEEGGGAGLLALADAMYGRDDEEEYLNSTSALVAVNCSDAPSPRDPEAYREAAERAEEEYPLFGASFSWSAMTCAYWPEEAVADRPAPTAEGAAPILVVGTTRDSATPYEWSEKLASTLESGVLLSRDGDGHTGYRMGDGCVDRAVEAYLLEREVPEDGEACMP